MYAVYAEIKRRLDGSPKPPLDDHLFEIVGKQFAIGKT